MGPHIYASLLVLEVHRTVTGLSMRAQGLVLRTGTPVLGPLIAIIAYDWLSW